MEVARKVHYDACDMQNGELTWSCGGTNGGGGGNGGGDGSGDGDGRNSPECPYVLDSSVEEFDSPPPLQPRKLFNAADCNDDEHPINNNNKIPIFVTESIRRGVDTKKGILRLLTSHLNSLHFSSFSL